VSKTDNVVDLKTFKIEQFANIALGFTHAGAILTTVAMIDFMLQVFLFERMRTIGSGLRDKLFDGNGPLSTFSAKIDIAYAFNFIDKKTYETLKFLKEVRNHIAHSPHLMEFNVSHLPESYRSRKGFDKKKPLNTFMELFREVTAALEVEKKDD
jgi:DNA-binding MltR family transcriptional regulator